MYKLFKKELKDEGVREKAKRKPAPMTGTIVEERMLQEVVNIQEYLERYPEIIGERHLYIIALKFPDIHLTKGENVYGK